MFLLLAQLRHGTSSLKSTLLEDKLRSWTGGDGWGGGTEGAPLLLTNYISVY
jgi:hypothetical protein